MPKVLVPLAPGCEELEAVTLIDLLRRAEFDVVTASLTEGPVQASRRTCLVADTTLEKALKQEYDLIVLPGGMPGTTHLAEDERLLAALRKQAAANRHVAAICAAPIVLAKVGILAGKRATAYPGFLENLGLPDIALETAPVVIDGRVITSRGPGTAMDFALTLIEVLAGRDQRDQVERQLQRSPSL